MDVIYLFVIQSILGHASVHELHSCGKANHKLCTPWLGNPDGSHNMTAAACAYPCKVGFHKKYGETFEGLFRSGWNPYFSIMFKADPIFLGRTPCGSGAMSRHSKHSNDRMFFTAKERADAGYSKTRKDRRMGWSLTVQGEVNLLGDVISWSVLGHFWIFLKIPGI